VAGDFGRRGVVARIGKLENESEDAVVEISGASLAVSVLAAVLITSCAPALSADFESLNSANAK